MGAQRAFHGLDGDGLVPARGFHRLQHGLGALSGLGLGDDPLAQFGSDGLRHARLTVGGETPAGRPPTRPAQGVAAAIESLQPLGRGRLVLRRPARHQPAGALGKEADDLVLAVLEVLEHAVDHAGLQHFAIDRLEVLLRGQVDDDGRFFIGQPLVQVFGDARAPELVEVGARAVARRVPISSR
jgi:hypothetical protein